MRTHYKTEPKHDSFPLPISSAKKPEDEHMGGKECTFYPTTTAGKNEIQQPMF